MTLDLLPADDPSALALADRVANHYAARDLFRDYPAQGGEHAAAVGWRAGHVCGLPVDGRHHERAHDA